MLEKRECVCSSKSSLVNQNFNESTTNGAYGCRTSNYCRGTFNVANSQCTCVKPSLMRLCLKVLANCSSSSRSLGSSRVGVSILLGGVWLCGRVWMGVAADVRVGVAGCKKEQRESARKQLAGLFFGMVLVSSPGVQGRCLESAGG